MNTIRTHFVRVGNSRGLRMPKVLIEQLGLGAEVEIAIERDCLVIRSASRRRGDWDDQFRAMADRGDDALFDKPRPTEWEKTEWQW